MRVPYRGGLKFAVAWWQHRLGLDVTFDFFVQALDAGGGSGALALVWRSHEGEPAVAGLLGAGADVAMSQQPVADEGFAPVFDLLVGGGVGHASIVGGHLVMQPLGRKYIRVDHHPAKAIGLRCHNSTKSSKPIPPTNTVAPIMAPSIIRKNFTSGSPSEA